MLGRKNTWWLDSLFLIFFLGSLFFLLLGVRPLFTPDEGRYAEIAREMVVSNDFVTPYLNGIKYFEKPILFYWLEAAAIKAFGLNLWSLRSINALLGLLGCLLTYVSGRLIYDRRTGLLAALTLGTSLLYFIMNHMISLDLPVSVAITACLFCFMLGYLRHARIYFWGAAVASALAVLTKGLIGLLFPTMIIGSWIIIFNEWRVIKRMHLLSALLIFFIIVTPWHWLVGARNPEFYFFYFIEQHFLRYLSPEIGHEEASWFFIPYLFLGFFPWIVFLPQTLFNAMRRAQNSVQTKMNWFLLLWIAIIFIFFSFSKSKLIPYILPIFPPLALLTARYFAQVLDTQKLQRGIKSGYFFLVLFACILAYAFYKFTQNPDLTNTHVAKIFGISVAVLLVAGSCCAFVFSFRKMKLALTITFTMMWLSLILMMAAIPSIETRSIYPLTQILNPILKANDDVITYNQYYQDLPFYLQRKVSILNWRNELRFGMQHQANTDWMIDDQTFWQRWHSARHVFVFINQTGFKQLRNKFQNEKFYVLGTTPNSLLITNHESGRS